ncbi:translocation/assembly module TamB domain-containing protein [Pseudosulfitobacter sp. DSM 107133]|uniref:translocation/assembly module TamB domain-containing protein n=1 Tax=Pseudosulfitobacter sp. DSM 107133 TaxID=2883100 RepID=UPI000DF4A3AB|nr:translocation/assembly module TamB domain-containing protein [Pseudosulfitobacter sp. DSM 107133]UOA28631.1 Translocation and assembly module subunit TamB [Pseudosulfitobacter sp. DSM 107133]
MKHFLLILAATLMLCLPGVSSAQSDDRGYLQAFLEDSLSGAGRQVRIIGFEGALSSQVSIQELTIADDEGIWLTLKDVVLDWSRAALLTGRLEVNELSVAEVLLPRKPVPSDSIDVPAPEASGRFSIPDLPVSININAIKAGRVDIGAALFGEAAVISLSGSARLADGEGTANVDINRIDATRGDVTLAASYANETGVLDLNLTVSEDSGGIVSTLLTLPGDPSVDLTIAGAGPLDDFTADITLATDDTPRLDGSVSLKGTPSDAAPTTAEDGTVITPPLDRSFVLDLGGDIAPVFAPRYGAFFGDNITLKSSGTLFGDGRLTLESLDLDTRALTLTGNVALGADGWPSVIVLDGRIADADGTPVLLPLPGEQTQIDTATLAVRFDAATGAGWDATIAVAGLDQPTLKLDRVQLQGNGTLTQGDAGQVGGVQGKLTYAAQGIALTDTALAQAVGPRIDGGLIIDWTKGAPLALRDIDLSGADYGLTGLVQLDGLTDDLNLSVAGDMTLTAADLSRFALVSGQDLQGATKFDSRFTFAPLSGAFDVALNGTATDLAVGIPQADPLIAGQSRLSLSAQRDETGTRIENFEIATNQINATVSGTLSSDASDLKVAARVNETSLIQPGLNGPSTLNGTIRQAGSDVTVDVRATGPGGADVTVDGTLALVDGTLGRINAEVTGALQSLAPYATLANRPLSGAANVTAQGWVDLRDYTFDLKTDLTGQNLSAGIPQLDGLLRGPSTLNVVAQRDGTTTNIDSFTLTTDHITARVNGTLGRADSALRVDARVPDTAVVAPGLSGAATLNGTLRQTGTDWAADMRATGPGRADVRVTGTVPVVDGAPRRITATVQGAVQSLSPYSALAGRSLGGAANVNATGWFDPRDNTFDLSTDVSGQNLGLGIAEVDQLLRGASTLDLAAHKAADQPLIVDRLNLKTLQVQADVTATTTDAGARLNFDASLRDIGLFADGINGPATAKGTAEQVGTNWRVNIDATGPQGTTASLRGQVATDASSANIDVTGAAPVGLANTFIAPKIAAGQARFDLSLNGPLALSSLSGRISTEAARLVLPEQSITLAPIVTTVSLSGGRATLDVTATVSTGGTIRVTGPVGLDAPNTADLAITLSRVRVTDPKLYETTIDGRATVSGALTGGAAIKADLTLANTEIRVPEGGAETAPVLEGLKHISEPAAVRATRARAGLIEETGAASGSSGGGGVAYPIDITLNAPARIFVRGRGLEAELGGKLRLTGTTANVVPIGRFDLIRGRFDILTKRLTLSEGSAQLQGGFDPYIRFVADTTASDGTIRIIVEGLASEPEITFTSSPEKPQDEILAQLLFGRDLSKITPLQAVQLAAAVRTLAGKGGGLLNSIRERFGLDDLDIVTDENGETGARVGKYLTDNIYTDVTVGAGGGAEVNLNLTISPSLTARGSVTSTGETGLGVFFERDY